MTARCAKCLGPVQLYSNKRVNQRAFGGAGRLQGLEPGIEKGKFYYKKCPGCGYVNRVRLTGYIKRMDVLIPELVSE